MEICSIITYAAMIGTAIVVVAGCFRMITVGPATGDILEVCCVTVLATLILSAIMVLFSNLPNLIVGISDIDHKVVWRSIAVGAVLLDIMLTPLIMLKYDFVKISLVCIIVAGISFIASFLV